jgi:hypothetical protein
MRRCGGKNVVDNGHHLRNDVARVILRWLARQQPPSIFFDRPRPTAALVKRYLA